MKRARGLIAAIAMLTAIFGACSKSNESSTASNTRCDPGSSVFCICFDNSPGTKACTGDGQGFEACLSSDTGEDCSKPSGASGSGGDGAGGFGGFGGFGGSGGAGAGGSGATTTIASSSSAVSSSGAGGAGGASAATQCPGDPISVTAAADTTVVGDTSASIDGNAGACGGMGSPEVVYAVTPQATGTLVVTLAGVANGDPVLYARQGSCDASGTPIGCSDATGPSGSETLTLEAIAGSTYWIFADGHGPSQYSLTLHLVAGVIPGDTCGIAVPLTVQKGIDVYAAGDTSVATANYKGTGACATSMSTKDIVYSITPASTGTLVVTMSPTFDGQLYSKDICTAAGQTACSEVGGIGVKEAISIPVTQGTKVSIFADGQNGSAGPYTMLFHLQ